MGYFNDFAGELNLSDDPAKVMGIKAEVKTGSVYSRSPVRDEGLKSPLFFDSEKFPQATFVSTSVEGKQLNGTLTIKGISKPVSLTIEQPEGKILLKGSFNRNDYGMDYNQLWANKQKAIGDMVELTVELNIK